MKTLSINSQQLSDEKVVTARPLINGMVPKLSWDVTNRVRIGMSASASTQRFSLPHLVDEHAVVMNKRAEQFPTKPCIPEEGAESGEKEQTRLLDPETP